MLSLLWNNRSLACGLPPLVQDRGTAALVSVTRNVYLMLQTLQGLPASRRVAKGAAACHVRLPTGHAHSFNLLVWRRGLLA
jgi:hypothetical protein